MNSLLNRLTLRALPIGPLVFTGVLEGKGIAADATEASAACWAAILRWVALTGWTPRAKFEWNTSHIKDLLLCIPESGGNYFQ